MHSDKRTIQVIKLPAEDRRRMQALADSEGEILAAIFDRAVQEFIEHRRKTKKDVRYFAASKKHEDTPLWISDDVLAKARRLAEKDGYSVRAVLLTAVFHFLDKQ